MSKPAVSLAILSACLVATVATARVPKVQDDWSGGPGEPGPVTSWGDRFDAATDVAWRAIPGQVALASHPLAEPVRHLVADDAGIPNAVASGDLDGDGRDDLITTDPVTDVFQQRGAVDWWKRDETGSWSRRPVSEDFYGATYAAAADVDRDGDLDVIAAAYYGVADPEPPPPPDRNGRFAWFENVNGDASAWRQHLVAERYWGATWIDAGDLDGDGDVDLAGTAELTDGVYEKDADVAWFENLDGAGRLWAEHSLDDAHENASEVHVVDLDQDGDRDLLVANSDSFGPSQHHWWENLGDASAWTKRAVPGEFSGSGYVDVGDLDDDGDLDLIGSGRLSGSLLWWENLDGAGTSWRLLFVSVLPNGDHVELADVDGDGDLDALAVGGLSLGGQTAWWVENVSGDALLWELHTVQQFLEIDAWIAAADADADGKLDAVVSQGDASAPRTDELAWFELSSFVSAGELTSAILDGGDAADWGLVDWDDEPFAATALTVEVRAGDDPAALGPWVEVAAPRTELGTLVEPGARYLQLRLALSGDGTASPVVREVGVDVLRLDPLVPGRAGEDNTLTLRGARPGDRIAFLFAGATGTTPVPGCADTTVGLAEPRRAGSAVAAGDGTASATFPVPPSASGRTVYFQAVDRTSCAVSDVSVEVLE